MKWDQECKSCSGTGLYIGFAEKDGASVICNKCKGAGKQHQYFEYTEFTGRKDNSKATHVFAVNPGIGVDNGKITPGGVSKEEWMADSRSPFQPGNELRQHTCPAWWYQSADYNKKPDWKECLGVGTFARCQYFPTKHKCWERWDKENSVEIL